VIRKHIFFAVLSALLMIYLSGQVLIGWFSSLLQRASTTMAVWLFALTGVPVQREGFVLHTVNNVSVFVSKDCGGIRSTLAMLILAVVATRIHCGCPGADRFQKCGAHCDLGAAGGLRKSRFSLREAPQ
jgi:hypothetical protein